MAASCLPKPTVVGASSVWLAKEGGEAVRATKDLMRQTDAPKSVSLPAHPAHQGVFGSRTFGKVANSTL
jgi:hypothetical protein